MKILLSHWVVFVGACNLALGQTQPVLKFDNELLQLVGVPSSPVSVENVISDEDWYRIFPVYTREAFQKQIDQPVAGRYEWKGDIISFEPAFAFAPGEVYYAVFSPATFFKRTGLENEESWQKSELSFSVPDIIHPITTIESIYPESATLPRNLLRMYIYFSAPMMPGNAYDNITLVREDGKRVEKAFLQIDQELWDVERRRFTLLFDPGRIKRSLKSNIDLGTPLKEGEMYTLVIDSSWRDVHGNPLAKSITKTFFVTPAERSKISAENWKVTAPLTGSRGEVVISFNRRMDHFLALKHISINNASGVVAGRVEVIEDSVWKFKPDHPWVKGEYVIIASPLLEDVAGNNLMNSFDLDLSNESRVNAMEVVELPLVIPGVDP